MIEIVLYVIILDVQALRLNSVPNGQLKKKVCLHTVLFFFILILRPKPGKTTRRPISTLKTRKTINNLYTLKTLQTTKNVTYEY